MDSAYRGRDLVPADWEAWSSALNRSGDSRRLTAETLRTHARRMEESGILDRRFVVELRGTGRGVGFAAVYREPVDADPSMVRIGGIVEPEHRRHGIGTFLLEAGTRDAQTRGFRMLLARAVVQPPDGLVFLRRRGFAESRRSLDSVMDVSGAALDSLPELLRRPSLRGIRVSSWADELRANGPEAEERAYALCAATSVDVPTVGVPLQYTPDQFRRWVIANPSVPPESIFLAKDGERMVGISYGNLVEGDPTSFFQQFTGTLRDYRGRGIGSLLKLKVIEYAVGRGIQRIRTLNDAENVPILRMNERLGFRPQSTWVYLDRDLRSGPPGPNLPRA